MKERTFKKMIFAVFCCQFLSIPLLHNSKGRYDTYIFYSRNNSIRYLSDSRSTFYRPPASILQRRPENLHALQVSDAVKHFAGVTVKDYGGIGGLKQYPYEAWEHNIPLLAMTGSP